MENAVTSTAEEQPQAAETTTTHHISLPPGLTQDEFAELTPPISEFHTYRVSQRQCSSILAQRIHAPLETVWSVVRRFDRPQTYKHFIKSCTVAENFTMTAGCTRDVSIISGLPAETSTERLDVLDDDRHVTGFTIIGGEHRMRNYHSVTTVHSIEREGKIWTVVLESYVVDVPEGNTEEDTRLFADTVVKLNLQKLASITEGMSGDGDSSSVGSNPRPMGRETAKKKAEKKKMGLPPLKEQKWLEFKQFKEKDWERMDNLATQQEKANNIALDKTRAKKMKIWMQLSEKEYRDDHQQKLFEILSAELFGN